MKLEVGNSCLCHSFSPSLPFDSIISWSKSGLILFNKTALHQRVNIGLWNENFPKTIKSESQCHKISNLYYISTFWRLEPTILVKMRIWIFEMKAKISCKIWPFKYQTLQTLTKLQMLTIFTFQFKAVKSSISEKSGGSKIPF